MANVNAEYSWFIYRIIEYLYLTFYHIHVTGGIKLNFENIESISYDDAYKSE